MAPRKRNKENRDLEPNLYQEKGYFRYRNPVTGDRHSMGTDKQAANTAARKLNAILIKPNDLVTKVLSKTEPKFSHLVERYRLEYLPTKKLKPNTLRETGYRLNRIVGDLGDYLVIDMSVKLLADYLDSNFKNDAYIKHRGLLTDIFRFGLTKGMCQANPADDTLAKNASEKERQPLTKEWFDEIYAFAPEWLQNAMDFALISLQRRGDLCLAKFDDIEDNHLKIVQQKTEKYGVRAHLRIELGPSLVGVIKRSRKSGIASPYIIHRRPERRVKSKDTDHWTQVRPEILTKEFAKVRDQVEAIAKLPAKQRPTFHEIRALGGHLYLEAGYSDEYVQSLMGHATAKMTAHYTDRHVEWTVCAAGLVL